MSDPWARRHIYAYVRALAELTRPARLLYEHLVEADAIEAAPR